MPVLCCHMVVGCYAGVTLSLCCCHRVVLVWCCHRVVGRYAGIVLSWGCGSLVNVEYFSEVQSTGI